MSARALCTLLSVSSFVIASGTAHSKEESEGTNSRTLITTNFGCIGKPIGRHPLLDGNAQLKPGDPQKTLFPRKILVELEEGVVESVTLYYSSAARPRSIAEQLNKKLSNYRKYPELVEHGLWLWRSDEERIAIQMTRVDSNIDPTGEQDEVQVIVSWLDRKTHPEDSDTSEAGEKKGA